MPNIAPKIHTEQFLVRISPRLKRRLKVLAQKEGCTQSEYVRKLIILSDVVKPKKGG